jgi:hypothetical protein
LIRIDQRRQRCLHSRLALACRQVQDLQILPGRPLRRPGAEQVIGQAEAAGGEQVVAVAVGGERARLAHQPVDDVPVDNAVLAPPPQPRQPFQQSPGVPHFDVFSVKPRLDPFTDQSAGHRVDVVADMDGAARIDPHTHAPTRLQSLRRERTQSWQLLGQTLLPAGVQLGKHLPHERFVAGSVAKVAAAAQQEGLVEGSLELPVALLGVAVLVGRRGVGRLALQAVVAQQCLVALGECLAVFARRNGGGETVGPMQLGDATQFPQRVLQAVVETLPALSEADRAGLPVGVGQHEVIDQVLKRHAGDGDAQPRAVREVGGAEPSRLVDLSEEDFLGWAVQGTPLLDTTLEGPELAVRELAGVMTLEIVEQGLGLQSGIEPQLFFELRPDIGERIVAGPPGAVHTSHLAGQLAEPPVLARGLGVHAGLGRCLLGEEAEKVETAETAHLLVGDHPKPPCRKGLRIGYVAQLRGKCSCR